MYKFIVSILVLCAFDNALAARKVNFETLQQVAKIGEIYNINILFSSENNSKGESYAIAHYGGYYMGRCNDHGPCGCGAISNVSLLKFGEKEKLDLIETKTVGNSCSSSEDSQYSVKYNKEYVFLFSEKDGVMALAYLLNKNNPELGFVAEQNYIKSVEETELNNSYVSDMPYIDNKPGFNCKKASNYVEKQICNSVELSELDAKMSSLYKDLLNSGGNIDASMLKRSQIEFNSARVKLCADVVCIKELTSNRIIELTK